MNTYRCNFGILSALALLTTRAACVGPPASSTADSGNVEANLKVSSPTALNTASYAISGPNMFARSGTIDVSHSQTISVTVGGIPAGSGYNARSRARRPTARPPAAVPAVLGHRRYDRWS